MSVKPNSLNSESSGRRAASIGIDRLVRFIPITLLLGVLIGAVYAGFVATHTFNYPGTSAPITSKSCAVTFLANVASLTLATCGSTGADFNVAGSGSVIATATTALQSGSGVTLTSIQAAPLSVPCAAIPPTTGTGVVTIPLPGASASVTFNGGTDYDYCIYYTSGVSITAGSFAVTYSG